MPRRSFVEMSVDLADGTVMNMSPRPHDSSDSATITVIEEIEPRLFEACPICGAPPTDDEHVPPASLGGQKMTRTCGPCNNKLGSHVEADLTDWYDQVLTLPRFAASNVMGPRKVTRIPLRWTPSGAFVLILDGKVDPAIVDMLRTGEVDLTGHLPDPNRYRIALLKHAYLAACMRLGILAGDGSDQIRHDLVAARDAPSRQQVPASAFARGLTIMRHFGAEPLTSAPAVIAEARMADEVIAGVLLAGRIFVSWSSSLGAGEGYRSLGRLELRLTVGKPIQGTVRSVSR